MTAVTKDEAFSIDLYDDVTGKYDPAPEKSLFNASRQIWVIGDWPIKVPEQQPVDALTAAIMVKLIRDWTGWSTRHLGELLNTSHTTVAEIERGRPIYPQRSRGLEQRIEILHKIVERLYLATNRNSELLARICRTPASNGQSFNELIMMDRPEIAYVAALDILTPRSKGLLVNEMPKTGDAIAALHD